ncbi:MAG: phospholipase D-like domain-containing protein [Desulfuromonadaceae bacterium]|nr:phospholipase D-like domain-containing protein [Desulfuromonadaceae bacterium]
MKLLVTAQQIREMLYQVAPSKIAVAFIGKGWKKFIPTEQLQEIVVSPTFGSNPKAIEEIMKVIGDEKVYFLDQLHSKAYIGKDTALIGSCNLSDNGMGDNHLMEMAVFLEKSASIAQLENTFEEYKKQALNLYPNLEAKKARLRMLTKQWNTAVWHGVTIDDTEEPSLMDYESVLDTIHIAFYQPDDLVYNSEAIDTIVPESKGVSPDDYFSEQLQFLEEDPIEQGDWILCWHCNNDGYPRKNGDVSWMRAHYVIPHGVVDEDYTKLVCQAKNLEPGSAPFRLDPTTKELIRNALYSGQFPELLSLDDSVWHLTPADAVTQNFLQHIRQQRRE